MTAAGAALAARDLRGDRLHELFPALAFDPDGMQFLLADPALGFGFRCRPVVDPTGVGEGLTVLLNQAWPTGTLIQFSLFTSPDIEAPLRAYQGLRHDLADPVLAATLAQRLAFWRRGTREPVESVTQVRIRDVQLLVTVKLPLATLIPTPREGETARELRDLAFGALRTTGLAPTPLDAEGYLRFMHPLLNGGDSPRWQDRATPLWDPGELLQRQVVDYATALQVDRDGLWLGATRVTVLSCQRLPDEVTLGFAGRYLGDALHNRGGVREPLLVTAVIHFPDPYRTRGRIDQGWQWAANQAYGPLAKWMPQVVARKAQFDALIATLEEGDRPVQLYLGFALFTPDEDTARSAAGNLQTFYRTSRLQVLRDQAISLPLFLNLLPFGAELAAIPHLFRYRTLASSQTVPLLPVFGDWAGTGTPAFHLISRNGQFMALHLYDSSSNYNTVVAAASGAGKSFFTNELIAAYLSLGARVWVIDVGRSYQKLATALNGQFIAFTHTAHLCLNPFPLIGQWDEEADMLAAVVTVMAAPNEPLNNLQAAELKRVLQAVWETHGTAAGLDEVAAALCAEPDPRVQDLGRQLYPFTRVGEYGRFFNGPNTLVMDAPFIVLELEELKGRLHLQQVVLLLIIYQIQQAMYRRPEELQRYKLAVIDEAWELLQGAAVARFLETSYRRFRKYNGAAVMVTQSLNDLYATPAGVAIAENSANRFLLHQTQETVSALERSQRLTLGAGGYALLRTVHTEPGAYAEILCLTEYGGGVGRLIVDPYSRLLYSTKAEEVQALRDLMAQGLSQDAAIRALLARRDAA